MWARLPGRDLSTYAMQIATRGSLLALPQRRAPLRCRGHALAGVFGGMHHLAHRLADTI